eukprot:g30846.t1
MVLQGTHDTSWANKWPGLRQETDVDISVQGDIDNVVRLKEAVWVYRASHSQWSSSAGDCDVPAPSCWITDRAALL